MHNGDELIKAVADNCDNTIPVIQSVGPVDMESWIDHPNITAVVWANLGGQELGPALVDILYGKVNPSGRLVYTIARNASDYAQPNIVREPQPYPQINYTEGVSVDYRGFKKGGKTPRFWFGHGLSYSNFSYSNLQVNTHSDLADNINIPIKYVADAPGGDSRLYDLAVTVSFDIHNDEIIATILNNGKHPKTGWQLLKEATLKEMFTNQVPQFPDFARNLEPTSPPQGWGLSFFTLLHPGPTGRSANAVFWTGLANLVWWADVENGIGGIMASQILPFGDSDFFNCHAEVETQLYAALPKSSIIAAVEPTREDK
ncbi:hypothetical protein O988_04253 [Pseudogymnoascus sp. VKM F-3808]|nr:hypothetical protein O988_04253 [Pseudogymnoascus sp. VKM F-3808]